MATCRHEAVPNSKPEIQAMQIHAALDLFLVQLKADGRSSHTAGQYRRHLTLLASWAASEGLSGNVEDIDHQALARFLGSSLASTRPDGRPKLQTSTNALRSSLRAFFAYAHSAGLTKENPARMVRRAICEEGPPRALTAAEEERLLAVLATAHGAEEQRDAVLFRLMLRAGLRLGSALGLDVGDVDIVEGTATIRAKGGRLERVFLPARTQAELGAHLAGRAEGPIFASQSGRRLSARHVQRRFSQIRDRAGMPQTVTCHSLRHSFGTALLARTGDIELVRRALSHRSVSSTQIYARCGDQRLREAVGA